MSDPSILEIQQAVCAAFGMPLIDMRSHRRARSVARPRQVAMYLARHLTTNSLPAIGRHFGNRDHTTVLHAINVVTMLAGADADFGARVVDIRQHLSGEVAHEPASGDAGVVGGLLVKDPPVVAKPASCVPVPAGRDMDEQRPTVRR